MKKEKKEKNKKACLHTEVFKNLGIDESTLPNHVPFNPDERDDNIALAKELIKVARMLLDKA